MDAFFQNFKKPSLFQVILDSLIDGILILNERGEWVDANARAEQICRQLMKGKAHSNLVPQEIWCICQALIGSHCSCSNQPVVIEDEITTDKATALRIRAQWIDSNMTVHPYMLVMLENRNQSTQVTTIDDVKQYNFTPREAEVWLLHRAGFTYKEIAAKLFISLNTVKKHMKSIHAKRQAALEPE